MEAIIIKNGVSIKLPTDYKSLHWKDKINVREGYIRLQKGKCLYCGENLSKTAPKHITEKEINWSYFPKNFLKYPIHLQHDHNTGLTEGAVHNYCNAVMWQYEGK